jgi:hypothetical protein
MRSLGSSARSTTSTSSDASASRSTSVRPMFNGLPNQLMGKIFLEL